MRIINKTIRKSKIELKGGDGELGWKSKLPEVQMFKRFVENDNDFTKHSKLEVLSPHAGEKKMHSKSSGVQRRRVTFW